MPFPKSVSIPRLPTIFVTPMGAIEFTLGELFQDRWAKAAMEDTGNGRRWASFQKHRLLSLLDWQRKEVKDALTSPWMALKRAKPAGGLFLSEASGKSGETPVLTAGNPYGQECRPGSPQLGTDDRVDHARSCRLRTREDHAQLHPRSHAGHREVGRTQVCSSAPIGDRHLEVKRLEAKGIDP